MKKYCQGFWPPGMMPPWDIWWLELMVSKSRLGVRRVGGGIYVAHELCHMDFWLP